MLPFRELEVFNAFVLDDRECIKVGSDKYLAYDEAYEPESLELAEPDMMVDLVEDGRDEDRFFHELLDLLEGMERAGEKMTIKSLKKFAKDFISMPEDP